MLKYFRAVMKGFSLPCWSNGVQTHTYVTGVCDSVFGSSAPQESIHLAQLAPAGSRSYAEVMRCHQTWSICWTASRDHVCVTLTSMSTKLCRNLPLLSSDPQAQLPHHLIQIKESLPDLTNLNTFIYKWGQVWVIRTFFSKRKKVVCIFLMDLHLLYIVKEGKILITF